ALLPRLSAAVRRPSGRAGARADCAARPPFRCAGHGGERDGGAPGERHDPAAARERAGGFAFAAADRRALRCAWRAARHGGGQIARYASCPICGVMTVVTEYSQVEPKRSEVDALAGATVLEFGSPWCGWCRRAQPLIAQALAA